MSSNTDQINYIDQDAGYSKTFWIKLTFLEPMPPEPLVSVLRQIQNKLTASGYTCYSSHVEDFECGVATTEMLLEDILSLSFQKEGKYADLIPEFKRELILALTEAKLRIAEASITRGSIDKDTNWYPL